MVRITLVDDNRQFDEEILRALRSRGHDALRCESAGLSESSVRPPPDVVLLGSQAESDALTTLAAVHLTHPGVPVIMLGDDCSPATIVAAISAGAADYIPIPATTDADMASTTTAILAAVDRAAGASTAHHTGDVGADEQIVWGKSASMQHVLQTVERVAPSDVTVLITGESGVGKEVIARRLHLFSPRADQPFVKVNCAALPADLLESELFGHERGAFTDAQMLRIGRFEFADRGTIMLDEIAELPGRVQAKLLHVLQDGVFTRIGSNRAIASDARVVGATNRDLAPMMRAGQFRPDLYYRLQVIEIFVPPLRDRSDEILPLAEFFLRRYAAEFTRPLAHLSDELRRALLAYAWPGNIRELENLMKRLTILRNEEVVFVELNRPPHVSTAGPEEEHGEEVAEALPKDVTEDEAPAASTTNLTSLTRAAAMAVEREAILRALLASRWNRRKAARALGVSYKTLLNKMKTCGISGSEHEGMGSAEARAARR